MYSNLQRIRWSRSQSKINRMVSRAHDRQQKYSMLNVQCTFEVHIKDCEKYSNKKKSNEMKTEEEKKHKKIKYTLRFGSRNGLKTWNVCFGHCFQMKSISVSRAFILARSLAGSIYRQPVHTRIMYFRYRTSLGERENEIKPNKNNNVMWAMSIQHITKHRLDEPL